MLRSHLLAYWLHNLERLLPPLLLCWDIVYIPYEEFKELLMEDWRQRKAEDPNLPPLNKSEIQIEWFKILDLYQDNYFPNSRKKPPREKLSLEEYIEQYR